MAKVNPGDDIEQVKVALRDAMVLISANLFETPVAWERGGKTAYINRLSLASKPRAPLAALDCRTGIEYVAKVAFAGNRAAAMAALKKCGWNTEVLCDALQKLVELDGRIALDFMGGKAGGGGAPTSLWECIRRRAVHKKVGAGGDAYKACGAVYLRDIRVAKSGKADRDFLGELDS